MPRDRHQDVLRISGPAVATTIPSLRRAVARFASDAGAHPDVVHQVRLAVSEAVTNAVLHAYTDALVPGPVEATAQLEDGEVVITICDEGHGLRPRTDSPGLGLGLATMSAVAGRCEAGIAEGGGTRICLRFALDGSPVASR